VPAPKSTFVLAAKLPRANWLAPLAARPSLAALYAQIIRRHSQRHSGWHVSADRNFALGGRRVTLSDCMDLIYRPERTQLLKLAAQKRIATVTGVEMFLAQGFAQWEMWMKRPAPQNAMRRAVLGALRAEERGRSSS